MLWSDPDKDITGWSENDRGVSFTFGPDVVSRFLQKHDMDLICRAHQVVEDGYEFFSKRQLVTLFSAPNYCGEFDNAGAMMSVDESLLCSFQILKPAEKKQKYVHVPHLHPPPTCADSTLLQQIRTEIETLTIMLCSVASSCRAFAKPNQKPVSLFCLPPPSFPG